MILIITKYITYHIWMDPRLWFYGILSMQITAVKCLKQFKVV